MKTTISSYLRVLYVFTVISLLLLPFRSVQGTSNIKLLKKSMEPLDQPIKYLGYQWWRTDGSEAGTFPIDPYPEGLTNNPNSVVRVGSWIFYTVGDLTKWELWKTNGTKDGTTLVKALVNLDNNIYGAISLTPSNDRLFFVADDGIHGLEVWVSDGTSDGTHMVKDIFQKDVQPPLLPPIPNYLMNVNGTLFFVASDGTGEELWKSDGTEQGTVPLRGVQPGYVPRDITEKDGILYYQAYENAHGQELWRSDGTDQGTFMIKDIVPGPDSSGPRGMVNVNGQLFFVVDQKIPQLWISDGTETGTQMVKEIGTRYDAIVEESLFNVNGTLFFIADDGTHGSELWRSDGTLEGTQIVKDIIPGPSSSDPSWFENMNGKLYFTATDKFGERELWVSDGTEAGTYKISNISFGTTSSNPGSLRNINGTLYFSAEDLDHGRELWISDGTEKGTVLVKDICPGPSSSNSTYFVSPPPLIGDLLFSAETCSKLEPELFFTVTTQEDEADATPGDSLCSTATEACSLRAAVDEANAQKKDVEISLPEGVYNLTQSTSKENTYDSLTIQTNINIRGSGKNSTIIDAGGKRRVFSVEKGGLYLSGLTIQGGYSAFGGGVYVGRDGNLFVEDASFQKNNAQNSGAAIESSGRTIIKRTLFQENGNPDAKDNAFRDSAISFVGSQLLMDDSLLLNNWGAAILLYYSGSALITNTSLVGNNIAIYNFAMPTTLFNVTISQNKASTGASAIYSGQDVTKVYSSTITENQSPEGYGVLYADPQYMRGSIFLRNTIVSGNSPVSCSGRDGGIVSIGNNIEDGTSCGFELPSDQEETNPQLGPLTYYRSQNTSLSLLTQAPLENSPVIDSGETSDCFAEDQLGLVRSGACDIGAVEYSKQDRIYLFAPFVSR